MENEISAYIISVRLKAGLNQERLAQEIGSNRSNIANYETGRAIPPGDVLLRIQQYESSLPPDKEKGPQTTPPVTGGTVEEKEIHRLSVSYPHDSQPLKTQSILNRLIKKYNDFIRR